MVEQERVQKAWTDACRIILSASIGSISDYHKYLTNSIGTFEHKKSFLSGKTVAVSSGNFAKNARFISNDESGQAQQIMAGMKFDINEARDLDSLIEALGERFIYAGNIMLGKSMDVQDSNNCVNAMQTSDSQYVYDSEYVACSSLITNSKHVFGSYSIGESNFVIGAFNGTKYTRCFEVENMRDSSDCYYCANMGGCQHCMFSFNQKDKCYMIGNRQLERNEYLKLKEKLVEDIRNSLMNKKSVPRIIDLICGGKRSTASGAKAPIAEERSEYAKKPEFAAIENAWQNVSSIVLGEKLIGLADYVPWLQNQIPKVRISKSPLSGKKICIPAWDHYNGIPDFITHEESMELANKSLDRGAIAALSLKDAANILSGISYTACEVFHNSLACFDTAIARESSNCFHGSIYIYDKYCACSFLPRYCEHVFGSSMLFSSKFCIRCYNSEKLTRCFEVSDSHDCSDCYFCHNCENLQDCMLCFNTKSKKYAIGNVEVGREKYAGIKKMVLDGIGEKLAKAKHLEISIYDLKVQ